MQLLYKNATNKEKYVFFIVSLKVSYKYSVRECFQYSLFQYPVIQLAVHFIKVYQVQKPKTESSNQKCMILIR